MIAYLKGRVLEANGGELVVGVPAGAGDSSAMIGYLVHTPNAAVVQGASVELHIYTHVREDLLALYGFASVREKQLFLSLLGVNGIGPKVAMSVMSHWAPAALIEAVLSEDRALLSKTPGVGKKTAERLVLELRDSFRKKLDSGEWSAAVGIVAQRSGEAPASGGWFSDARDALLGLGYRDIQIQDVLKKLAAQSTPASSDEAIRLALRSLSL